jgi:hypothetical protein
MHDMFFYSQEQYDEYERDLHGDGFSNEYQRASFESKLRYPPHNDRAEAIRLTEAGKFVVVSVAPYYCRVTDAIVGEHFSIVAVYNEDGGDAAESHAWGLHERVCDDASVFVYRLPKPAALPAVTDDVEDDCPF